MLSDLPNYKFIIIGLTGSKKLELPCKYSYLSLLPTVEDDERWLYLQAFINYCKIDIAGSDFA